MQTRPRVLLLGYYGQGNFGDDILLKVAHGLLRKALPQAQLCVLIQHPNGGYVQPMLNDDATLLQPAKHGKFDLIVHGGGGVAFDFAHYGLKHRLIEQCALALGKKAYVWSIEQLYKWLAPARSHGLMRVGMGLGIGTFSPGSPAFRDRMRKLADMDALWVRDAKSIANLRPFKPVLKAEVMQSADLAFLSSYWCGQMAEKAARTKPKLGLILRDWPHNAPAPQQLHQQLQQLTVHYDVTAFLFDANHDPNMQALLADYQLTIWQPHLQHIDAFANQLAQQDVLITSRAHGAICGACLGVPSVILDIEPKLKTIHRMLPNATTLIAADDFAQWLPALEKTRSISAQVIAQDVVEHRQKAQASYEYLCEHYFVKVGQHG